MSTDGSLYLSGVAAALFQGQREFFQRLLAFFQCFVCTR
jgi:hypothetical protein